MLYILNISYQPNNAVSNRLLGYYSALDEPNIEAKVVYLLPNQNKEKIKQQYQNLKVTYLWDWCKYNNKLIRFICFYINLLRIYLKLERGDIVYTYGINKATEWAINKEGVRVFAERTEHPDIVKGSVGLTSVSRIKHEKIAKKLAGLFVISQPLKDYFISTGIPSNKIEILNMIVDCNRFEDIKKTPTKQKYIAYCGTASNNKDGVDKLLKSFAIVTKEIDDIYLYVIGNTPSKQDEGNNLKLIEELGICEKVIFTGLVEAEDMPQLLKNAEVLALARPDNKQAKYGFPTKLGEYLLSENPVVVTKVGDIPKFLTDGESALLVSPHDDQEFAKKIIWALENKEFSARIGLQGSLIAKKHFSNKIVVDRMLKHIKI
jgi:glycosyltransferase involved in cell wall biosynthesis